ncbi:MAG TPA: hypothetical protein VJ698_01015 [Noviherbaspirillum sp.]|uniref:hypothetical protein n=1 Tax=Noviherbaspirillum sp. TaxID=1926288 RepID=UPI002B48959B|nr:hypothetical protein [Noviherbaspirillum sp.]HJV84027.1 hypothetical protein [Noviherbaspirillum sp.]
MKTALTVSTLIACATFAGCESTPNLDSRFGDSVNMLKAQQTLDPSASSSTEAIQVDGLAAKEAIGQYKKSFSHPKTPANTFSINIGAGSSSGSGAGSGSR